MSLYLRFEAPDGGLSLVVEDDGRVAYAYLHRANEVVAHVWIYNRCPASSDPEWDDPSKLPFANSSEYMSEDGYVMGPVDRGDVVVTWESDESGADPVAYIYLFEDLVAVIGVGDKPGYARFAIKDNPLAQVMDIIEG